MEAISLPQQMLRAACVRSSEKKIECRVCVFTKVRNAHWKSARQSLHFPNETDDDGTLLILQMIVVSATTVWVYAPREKQAGEQERDTYTSNLFFISLSIHAEALNHRHRRNFFFVCFTSTLFLSRAHTHTDTHAHRVFTRVSLLSSH